MKRRELERHLRSHGAQLLREGGSPQLLGLQPGTFDAIPRHREIDYRLARKLCKDLDIPPPTGSR